MKFVVNQKCMFIKAEDKGSITVYTLLTLPNFDKMVAIGNKVKGEFAEQSTVDVQLEINTKSERLKIQDENGNIEAKFIETARIFVRDVKAGE